MPTGKFQTRKRHGTALTVDIQLQDTGTSPQKKGRCGPFFPALPGNSTPAPCHGDEAKQTGAEQPDRGRYRYDGSNPFRTKRSTGVGQNRGGT